MALSLNESNPRLHVCILCIGYQPRSIIRSDYILAEYVTDMTTLFCRKHLKILHKCLLKYNLHSLFRKIAKIHSFWDISDHPRRQ